MTFEDDLESVHKLLSEMLHQRERKAAFRAASSKIFESMQEKNREMLSWVNETFKPEPLTPPAQRNELMAQSEQFMQEHLTKLRQQTDALRRWRDSI